MVSVLPKQQFASRVLSTCGPETGCVNKGNAPPRLMPITLRERARQGVGLLAKAGDVGSVRSDTYTECE